MHESSSTECTSMGTAPYDEEDQKGPKECCRDCSKFFFVLLFTLFSYYYHCFMDINTTINDHNGAQDPK
jgi:hypothetical protein